MNSLQGGAAVAPKSYADDKSQPLRPFIWIYRNFCWYGMQLERYARRLRRFARKATAPVRKRTRESYERNIGQPARNAAADMRGISRDTGRAVSSIAAATKRGGLRSFLAQSARCAVRGLRKYRTFLTSAVNHCLPVICVAALVFTAFSLFTRDYALAIKCGDAQVGYVEDENTYIEATEQLSERIITNSEDFRRSLNPSYSLVPVGESRINTATEICNNILLGSSDVVEAYGFFVNDRLICATASLGDIHYTLEQFLDKYRLGVPNETVTFTGTTKLVSGLYAAEKVVSSEKFRDIVTSKQLTSDYYKVRQGDTVEGILSSNGMTMERFLELNAGFGGLKAGSSVVIEKEQPVLQVESRVISSYEKTVAYSTVTEKDGSLYEGTRKLKTSGRNGTDRITVETVYVDGVEQSRTVVKTERIKEPVDEVYVVGTKKTTTTTKKPKTGSYSYTAKPKSNVSGSGRFTWPLPGVRTLSSKYGYRWGRLHAGVDISCGGVYGRTIVAADKGTVTTVRNSPSGYGLHVIINHGNGYTTVYAHCSAVLVSAGQTVSKGQAIAKVGNSGRSTGPHLHFEIRKNGTATNPMNYF